MQSLQHGLAQSQHGGSLKSCTHRTGIVAGVSDASQSLEARRRWVWPGSGQESSVSSMPVSSSIRAHHRLLSERQDSLPRDGHTPALIPPQPVRSTTCHTDVYAACWGLPYTQSIEPHRTTTCHIEKPPTAVKHLYLRIVLYGTPTLPPWIHRFRIRA